MNKKSREKKLLAQRLIAMLLCCFCLIAAIPTAAMALDLADEPTAQDGSLVLDLQDQSEPAEDQAHQPVEDADTSDDNDSQLDLITDEQEDLTFYDRLMAALACGDIYALLQSEPQEAEALTVDQLSCLVSRAWDLGDDGWQADLLEALDVLISMVSPQEIDEPDLLEQEHEEPEEDYDPVAELFDRLMACETLDEINFILDNLTEEEEALLDLFTDEQNDALEDKMAQLGAYDADLMAVDPNMEDYNAKNYVAYDAARQTREWNGWNSGYKYGYNDTTGKYIKSVSLGGVSVDQADSDSGYDYYYSYRDGKYIDTRTGKTLSNFYPGVDTGSADTTKKLVIVPADGYYVTQVTVACCDGSNGVPYNCGTWSEGKEFSQTFNVSAGGALEMDLPSRAFGHGTDGYGDESPLGQEQYFILIKVAPVPTPLFVEYDAGDIVNILSDASLFSDPDGWTDGDSRNNYGTTDAPDTEYTQYRYTYDRSDSDFSAAANWKHYANIVTADAKQTAAEAGYYFAGWHADYYTKCTVSNTGSNGNNKTYTFGGDDFGDANYDEGDAVSLFTNVRLTAQWEPIKLKVTKTVEGLTDTEFDSDHDYTVQVQKRVGGKWENYGDAITLTVDGDGSASEVISYVASGTYRVVETGNYDLTGADTRAYCTTTYTVEEVTVGTDGSVKELKVLNTYSDAPAAATVTITKIVEGNLGAWNQDFTFNVTGDSVADADKTFTLRHGQSKTIAVDIGDTITVSEVGEGFTTTYVITAEGYTDVSGTGAEVSYTVLNAADQTITFTNTCDTQVVTGVPLDTLPYILILALVTSGAVLMLKKRFRRED